MPNRYVRASAIESEPVNALSWQGEVFYRRLINRADDFGRYTANPNLLRAALFPLQLEQVTIQDVARLLAECVKVGLVFLYEAHGKQLLVMNKWEQGRAKRSDYTAPPEEVNKHMKTYVYTSLHMSPTPTPIPVPIPTPAPPPMAVESSEGANFPEAERPSESEVKTNAQFIGIAEWKALDWFDEMEGCGWKDHYGRNIQNWQAVLRRVKAKWEADGRPTQPPSNKAKRRNVPNL